MAAMLHSLDDNVTWLRRLMPALLGPEGLDLARKAKERPKDKAGNPKRRPPNIKWEYAERVGTMSCTEHRSHCSDQARQPAKILMKMITPISCRSGRLQGVCGRCMRPVDLIPGL